MIRAFIAIELTEDVRAAVEEAQARLKRARVGVKVAWVKIANLHLTLQFLGYVEEPVVTKISGALAGVAGQHPPFAIPVAGAGAFPDEQRPRVLWVGLDDSAGRLKALAHAVQAALTEFGFAPERREFSAHLTLGRIKPALSKVEGFPRPDAALTKALDSLKTQAFGTLRVEAVHLIQSQLHPEGSIYTRLSTHPLK